ncbi:MAG TPA: hypothetical protein DIC64_00460 [Alphaproteobacteria bacterium]|nr:hypothetical protein [Alphaproteobacteria bacterium]
MSELRDELEKNFASADLQSKENAVNATESNEDEQALDHQETIAAPKSYTKQFQEDFKSLSPEWQKYLTERERQIEKGFSDMGNKINAGKWADKFFDERKERLENLGFKSAEDYIGKLILLDDAMQESPEQTLRYLAKTYGIEQKNNNALSSLNEQKFLSDLAQYEQAIQKRQSDAAFFDVSRFEEAVNDNGQLKHPFVKDVKAQMIGALKGGEAKSLEEAYQKALWLNEQTRDKMIEEKINDVLSQKFEEAFKAKEISFSPHSKETAAPKELSLREELEAQFRKEF